MHGQQKIFANLALFLLLVFIAAGAPRLIGGIQEKEDMVPVPLSGGTLTAIALRDTGTSETGLLAEQNGLKQTAFSADCTHVPEKKGTFGRVCDANGNPLNPYHGRYQSMVYRIFVPEKGFG